MAEPDRMKIAASWSAHGFSCNLWTDPPGQRWEAYRHAMDEQVTVLEGEMEFEVAGAWERVNAAIRSLLGNAPYGSGDWLA
jgi:quercetin dioxygenase-like cupin family protein